MTLDVRKCDERSTGGNPLQDRAVAKRDGIFSSVLCRISQLWPVRFTMRALRGFWWLLGWSSPEKALPDPAKTEGDSPPARQCRAGRKRLRWATRLLLTLLPRRMQSALGYPVCTTIGCQVSPDVSCSPTKPCGKGSKRKQDDIDEEDEEPQEQQSWVEALNQELADEDQTADPDYEPTTIETDSEEYRTHNDTESDLEIDKGVAVIKDVETPIPVLSHFSGSRPAVPKILPRCQSGSLAPGAGDDADRQSATGLDEPSEVGHSASQS
ncbi:oogenesis-related [Chanos chanos]|uniref:Oogenesis-related n=1 Tax=Chanos chanos TaxID=29144 RepID=A0A6J2W876_CHACN|nr:uncharacterized protein LOC115820668 [Chanos chanos]